MGGKDALKYGCSRVGVSKWHMPKCQPSPLGMLFQRCFNTVPHGSLPLASIAIGQGWRKEAALRLEDCKHQG